MFCFLLFLICLFSVEMTGPSLTIDDKIEVLDTFKSGIQDIMSDYRRSYEKWKNTWKVTKYAVNKESTQQPKAIEVVCNEVRSTCDVECIANENTCEALNVVNCVISDMVSENFCETMSINGVNTCEVVCFEVEKHSEAEQVCEEVFASMVEIVAMSDDEVVRAGEKKVDVVVKFFHNIFSIVYAFSSQVQVVKYDSFIFQYHRPIDFVITIYDSGSDSRTNSFQERENDMI